MFKLPYQYPNHSPWTGMYIPSSCDHNCDKVLEFIPCQNRSSSPIDHHARVLNCHFA